MNIWKEVIVRGKRVKTLRKKAYMEWLAITDKKAPFRTVMRRIKKAWTRGLIKGGV